MKGVEDLVGFNTLDRNSHRVSINLARVETPPISTFAAAPEKISETTGLDGVWSGLDEYRLFETQEVAPNRFVDKITSMYGVGIFFTEQPPSNGRFVVCNMSPGSAAHMSKRIQKGDVLFMVNGERVKGWDYGQLREKIYGPPGTFVSLDLIRKDESNSHFLKMRSKWLRFSFRLVHKTSLADSVNVFTSWMVQNSVGGSYKMVRVGLMRGSPAFCHNTLEHGLVQAKQIEALASMRYTEDAICNQIENRLRLESALFNEVKARMSREEVRTQELERAIEDMKSQIDQEVDVQLHASEDNWFNLNKNQPISMRASKKADLMGQLVYTDPKAAPMTIAT